MHWHHSHCEHSDMTQPITAEIAKQLATPPPSTSKDIWLYELGRFLIQNTNAIIVNLFADDPPCSAQTCPEMRASEWQYLCAVHDPPKSCAAIDYCCHTLDWAATTLTQSKIFPSRLGLGSGSGAGNMMGGDKVLQQQMKEIKNIFRRVYRIFAHAWFQHREMFWRVESKTGLYVFFKMVCDEYGIIESENYTIPAEAEGLEPEKEQQMEDIQAPSLLKRDQDVGLGVSGTSPEKKQETYSLGDTTKRHRHTLSDYSCGVTAPIQEEAEEEGPASPEKPMLGRQSTALKDTASEQSPDTPQLPSSTEPEVGSEAEEAETAPENEPDAEPQHSPKPGIARSDTIKAPREIEEDSDTRDVTVIETPSDGTTSEEADEPRAASETISTDSKEAEAEGTTLLESERP